MNRQHLIDSINADIARLQAAVGLLSDKSKPSRRPIKDANGRTTGYVISPEARQRMSESQQVRWANFKAKRARELAAQSKNSPPTNTRAIKNAPRAK